MNYSYNDKSYLFNRLNKITDKNKIRDIIKIIMFKNNNSIIEQDDGTYIKFNSLTNDTYTELEQYINNSNYKIEMLEGAKPFTEYETL